MTTLTFAGTRNHVSGPSETVHIDLALVRMITREVSYTHPSSSPMYRPIQEIRGATAERFSNGTYEGQEHFYYRISFTKLDEWAVLQGPDHETIVEMWKRSKL